MLILGPDLEIDSFITKGRLMVQKQNIMVRRTFEK
jgi:hypothetical protein